MISRYVPLGLLCILLFLGCKTVDHKESMENVTRKESFKEDLTNENLVLSEEERINELVLKYSDNPKLLIDKIYGVIDSNNINYNDLIARLYIAIGDFNGGKGKILEIPEYNNDKNLLQLLAICSMGLNEEYLEYINKILELDPENVFALNSSANNYINLKKIIKAEELLFRSYNSDSENKKTKILFGDLELVKVESLNLQNKRVLSQKEEKIVTSHYKKALKFYLDANDINNPSYFVKLSVVYTKLGKKLDAVKALSSAIILEPENPWNYYDRGKLYFYTNNLDKALEDLLIAHSLKPEHFFSNVFLGRVYFIKGDVNSSLNHYKKVLEINPEYSPAYKDVSILYYIKGNKNLSLSYLTKAYKGRKDRDPFLPLYLINSLIEAGQLKESKYILENLVKYEKNSTMKGIYKYYLYPERTNDKVLNDALINKDENQRNRMTYYVACALERGGVLSLSQSLFQEVAESNVEFESKLAMYKLGEFNE